MAVASSTPVLAVNVTVDPTQSWQGWMNVSNLNPDQTPGAWQFGSGWGAADLTASLTPTTLTLGPNVNTWNPGDPYWVVDGQPNKWMEANFYVDVFTSFAGATVTFSGDTLANSLVAPYSAVAVIKEFTSGYGWVGMDVVPLVGGQSFSVSRTIGAGNVTQYGFMLQGPNADPATVGLLGQAVIAVIPEPSSLAVLSLGLLALGLARRSRV